MKLSRKNLGRVATTFLATAMLASLTAVPAMAADHGEFEPDAEETQVKINKSITKPGTSYLPDVDFDFDIEPAGTPVLAPEEGATFAKVEGVEDDKISSYPGAALITVDGEQQKEIDSNKTTNTVTLAEQLVIDLNKEEFTEPGEYYYTITENGGTYENGYSWVSQALTLKVIVARDESNDNALYIYGYELYDPEDPEAKTDTFSNLYLTDGTEDQTNGFDLSKIVTGTAVTSADEAAHYKFNITIKNENNNDSVKNYYAVVTHNNTACNSQPVTVYQIPEGTTSTEIEIAEGDNFHVYGLTANDSMTIEETEESAAGFKTSYVIDEGEPVQDNRVANIAKFENDVAAEYTNTKDAVSPTGIAMDIAPYALLVVIAAAGCFVFLRKRNED